MSVYVKEYTELKKYVVVVNGIRKSLYDYFDEFSGNRAVIQINKKNEPVSLSIINLSSNNVIYRDNYYLFESFSYNFSQKYYLGGDNVFASLSYYIGNKPNTVNTLVCDGEVSTQCGAGELFFDVPIIDYAFSEKEKLLLDKYFLAENVTSTSAILFNNMAGIPYCVKVSDYMHVCCFQKQVVSRETVFWIECRL